jgi:uncharacterized protein (TIGR02452 family)
MNKEQLISVFEDTKNIVESTKEFQLSKTSKHTFDEISKPINIDLIANIQTINSDTVSDAFKYSKIGKTAILNMASYNRPGGGVANGAKAQEECLFRCSNLYKVIPISHYPLNINEGLYTKDALFFKDKDYNRIDPFKVDVITIAAINLSKSNSYDILENYREITMKKISLMFDMALKNGCRNIILGAWGCGVFNNNPIDIANMFDTVIMKHYYYCFDNIVFAVINDHNSVSDNFEVFHKFFG